MGTGGHIEDGHRSVVLCVLMVCDVVLLVRICFDRELGQAERRYSGQPRCLLTVKVRQLWLAGLDPPPSSKVTPPDDPPWRHSLFLFVYFHMPFSQKDTKSNATLHHCCSIDKQ